MIYKCYNCGWRINQRRKGEPDNQRIGRYLLCNHHAFCSENCINNYLGNFKNGLVEPIEPIEPPSAKCSDWNEEGEKGWKVTRRNRNKKKIKIKKS